MNPPLKSDADQVRDQVKAQLSALLHDLEEMEDDLDALDANALSVDHTWRGPHRGNLSWDGTTVVLATGGPHVELRWDGREAIIVGYGWFGADRYSEAVDDPKVIALLETLAEMAEDY